MSIDTPAMAVIAAFIDSLFVFIDLTVKFESAINKKFLIYFTKITIWPNRKQEVLVSLWRAIINGLLLKSQFNYCAIKLKFSLILFFTAKKSKEYFFRKDFFMIKFLKKDSYPFQLEGVKIVVQ